VSKRLIWTLPGLGIVVLEKRAAFHEQQEFSLRRFFSPPSALAPNVYLMPPGTWVQRAGNSTTCTCVCVLLPPCGVFGSNCEWPSHSWRESFQPDGTSPAVLCCVVLSCAELCPDVLAGLRTARCHNNDEQ